MASSWKATTRSAPLRDNAQGTLIPGLRWRKAWRDLWGHKLRSLLVILSIAIGIFAFGLILGARHTITSELPRHYLSVVPASAILHTSPVDEATIEAIQRLPQVAVAEGRVSARLRFLNGDGQWHDIQLFAHEDLAISQVDIVHPLSGSWPPAQDEILIERNSLFLTGARPGDLLQIETRDGHTRSLQLAGLVHDMNQLPAQVTGIPYGYVSRDTLPGLDLTPDSNEVHIVVAETRFDKAHITRVADAVRDKLEKAGATVFWSEIPEPGKHLVDEFLPAIILLMTTLGLLALVLSAFLVINVITAIVTQQQKQIGIMKSIGARTAQITAIYLRMVLLLSIAALVLAVPLSAVGAHAFSRFIASQLNFDLNEFRPAIPVLLLEVAAGLLVPILAALYPIRKGTRVTVREAIQDYGLEASHSRSALLDSGLARLPVSRPMRISLRNTFRRRGRLIRTLITLMLGGAIFLSVLSVRASLFNTLEETLLSQGFDVQLQLQRPYRRERIAQVIDPIEGIETFESWRMDQGIQIRPDGTDGEDLLVYALPADTELFEPQLDAGRWLRLDDQTAIVVPTAFLNSEEGVAIGRPIIVRIGTEEEELLVVGSLEAFQPPITPPAVYINRDYFERLTGSYASENLIRLRLDEDADYSDIEARVNLEERLQAAGIEVGSIHSTTEDRAIFGERFNILTAILLIMAFLMAVVGALGLMGTMSINVLERKREIGVMRAIGAADGAIVRIFVVEGITIGLLSWFGALLLSQPMSRLISRQVGLAFLELPLDFQYNWLGPVAWLVIIVLISALASLLPAYSAAQLSVRQAVAYE